MVTDWFKPEKSIKDVQDDCRLGMLGFMQRASKPLVEKSLDEKILELRDKLARTNIKCEDCQVVIKVIDIDQHIREKHFD